MSIWKRNVSVEELNGHLVDTLGETLDIRVEQINDDNLVVSMPVDKRTHQPYGILHGGASVALAETAGSIAASLIAEEGKAVVGLEINANHLRKVTSGRVYATASPVHAGRATQVWDIRIADKEGRPVCISRLTMAVVDPVKK
ncbi:hotdog fold thioesterase [Spongiibacter nanhainus]|uniref:Hotdog fold thioesterase n=1 Tax=Spongiibacter nanhainus TaxID=2794344 RepID=A0A7T4R3J6_9GAMM|nr:hotdog fold thioesterase [Spongiibacter nanhainus]QQD19652.1 hotdog fold thioesterase [Spongiibacter nanhainus]